MMVRASLVTCRIFAAMLLLAVSATPLIVQPAYGRADGGGCLPRDGYLCITSDPETAIYEDKYCGSGGGESCITCQVVEEAICNAFGKDSDEGWYNGSSS